MTDDTLTLGEMREMAAEIGMTHLEDQHLQQLLRATIGARLRRGALRTDTLVPADEPAHVFKVTSDRDR